MQIAVNAIFALELALLFAHEMDAIRKQEWKMFIVLKDMADEKAYLVFMLLHVPLYTILLFLLFSDMKTLGYYIADIFLVGHCLLHFCYRNHPANKLKTVVSNILILAAGFLAIVHLVVIA